mgnify:CR=1 FL=1
MKLYAYGSSFTQGMELCDGDDSDQYKIANKTTWLKDYKYTSEILECERSLSWPNQLADMLGIECENKARSGNSELGMIHNYTIDLSNDVFDEDDIAVRAGHHCCQILHKKMKIGSSLRMSFGVYNNKQDIDAICESIKKCKKIFKLK